MFVCLIVCVRRWRWKFLINKKFFLITSFVVVAVSINDVVAAVRFVFAAFHFTNSFIFCRR